MTSLSSIGLQVSTAMATSPRDRLQEELLAEVASGAVDAADQAALSGALDSIDTALTNGAAARGADQGPGRPSPDEMKAKISALINEQVDNGTLTSDQAEALSTLFDNASKQGAHGAGGPPPGPPPGGGGPGGPGGAGGSRGAGTDEDDDTTSSSTSTDSDVAKLLTEFLAALKEATSTSAGYDATGKTSSTNAALLLDFQS